MKDDADNLLLSSDGSVEPSVKFYLEQYKIYLNMASGMNDRRQKSNEFFLGLNAAIIGILGYVETQGLPHPTIIFILIPLAGISIGWSWYRIINSFRQLNRAKFKVIHELEKKLPMALFKTEWEYLGQGQDKKIYYPLSKIEENIPITFIALYTIILVANFPWNKVLEFFK